MLHVHQTHVSPAQRVTLPLPAAIDPQPIKRRLRRKERKGLALFSFRERREARSRADQAAEDEARRLTEIAAANHAKEQSELDDAWRLLTENDPAVVIEVLEASFADNEAPAFPVNCEDGRATLVMLMEPEESMPERRPALTPTGRPTLKKFNQTERAQLYQAWLSSNVIATIREGFAVAPSLEAITTVVLRWNRDNPFNEPELDPLYVGTFTRQQFDRLDFYSHEALNAIYFAEDLRMETRGQSRKLVPMSPDEDLTRLMNAIKAALSPSSL